LANEDQNQSLVILGMNFKTCISAALNFHCVPPWFCTSLCFRTKRKTNTNLCDSL